MNNKVYMLLIVIFFFDCNNTKRKELFSEQCFVDANLKTLEIIDDQVKELVKILIMKRSGAAKKKEGDKYLKK